MSRHRRSITTWLLLGLAAVAAVTWVIPLVLVVAASGKSPEQISSGGFFGLSGSFAQFRENLTSAAQMSGLWEGFANSLLYGLLGAGIAVALSALAAYALVWLHIPHPFLWFMLIYSGTVFPFQIYIIPLSQVYKQIGLYDTRAGLILFYTAICIPFCTFLFRSYFMGMPAEIFEAARLDGASSLRTFVQIAAPLSVNPASLLFLTQFTWVWNDLLFGQVLSTSTAIRPVMPALAMLSGTNASIGTVSERMAAALVASIPPLLLFAFLRNKFMQGFSLRAR